MSWLLLTTITKISSLKNTLHCIENHYKKVKITIIVTDNTLSHSINQILYYNPIF